MIKTKRVQVVLELVLSDPRNCKPKKKDCNDAVKTLIEEWIRRYTECKDHPLVVEEYDYQVLK